MVKHSEKETTGAYGADAKKTYFRTMKSIDASDDAQVEKVMSMCGDAVLKGLAVRVVVDTTPGEDTSVHALVENLRELPQCHFV